MPSAKWISVSLELVTHPLLISLRPTNSSGDWFIEIVYIAWYWITVIKFSTLFYIFRCRNYRIQEFSFNNPDSFSACSSRYFAWVLEDDVSASYSLECWNSLHVTPSNSWIAGMVCCLILSFTCFLFYSLPTKLWRWKPICSRNTNFYFSKFLTINRISRLSKVLLSTVVSSVIAWNWFSKFEFAKWVSKDRFQIVSLTLFRTIVRSAVILVLSFLWLSCHFFAALFQCYLNISLKNTYRFLVTDIRIRSEVTIYSPRFPWVRKHLLRCSFIFFTTTSVRNSINKLQTCLQSLELLLTFKFEGYTLKILMKNWILLPPALI